MLKRVVSGRGKKGTLVGGRVFEFEPKKVLAIKRDLEHRRRLTLLDISEKHGVSPCTVSSINYAFGGIRKRSEMRALTKARQKNWRLKGRKRPVIVRKHRKTFDERIGLGEFKVPLAMLKHAPLMTVKEIGERTGFKVGSLFKVMNILGIERPVVYFASRLGKKKQKQIISLLRQNRKLVRENNRVLYLLVSRQGKASFRTVQLIDEFARISSSNPKEKNVRDGVFGIHSFMEREKIFKKWEPLFFKIINSFNLKGIERETTEEIAKKVFFDAIDIWDPELGAFSTHFYNYHCPGKIVYLVKQELRKKKRTVSFDEPINGREDLTFGEVISAKDKRLAKLPEGINSSHFVAFVESRLKRGGITKKTRDLVFHYFGLNGFEKLSVKEFKDRFNVTRQTVNYAANREISYFKRRYGIK